MAAASQGECESLEISSIYFLTCASMPLNVAVQAFSGQSAIVSATTPIFRLVQPCPNRHLLQSETEPDTRQVKRQRLSEDAQEKKNVESSQQTSAGQIVSSSEAMAVDDFAFREEVKPSAKVESVQAPAAPVAPPVIAPAAKATKKGKGKTSLAIAPASTAAQPPAAAPVLVEQAASSPLPAATQQASAGPTKQSASATLVGEEAQVAVAKFMDALKGKPEQALAAWTCSLAPFINNGWPVEEPHPLAQAMQRFQVVVVAVMVADGVDPSTEVMGRHKVHSLAGDGLKFGKAAPCLDARSLLGALTEANITAGARSKVMVAIRKMQVMLDVTSGKEASANFVNATASEMAKGKKQVPACLQRYISAAPAPAAAPADMATPPTKAAARPPVLAAKTPAIVRTARKGAPPGSVKPKPIVAALAPAPQQAAAAGTAGAPAAQADDDMSDDDSLPDLDFDVNVERESTEGSGAADAVSAPSKAGQNLGSNAVDADAMEGQEEAMPSLNAAAASTASSTSQTSVGSSASSASEAFSEASVVRNVDALAAPAFSTAATQSADVEMDLGQRKAAVSGPTSVSMPPPPVTRSSVSAPVPATPAASLPQLPSTTSTIAALPGPMATAVRSQVPSTTPASAAAILSTTGKMPGMPIAGPQSGNIASLNAAANAKKAQEEADAKRIEARAALRAQIDQRKAAAAAGVAAPASAAPVGPVAATTVASVPAPARSVAAEAEAKIRAAEEEKKAVTAAAAAARAAEAAAATQGVREKAVAAISAPAAAAPQPASLPTAVAAAHASTKPLVPASAGVGPKAPLSAMKAPLPGGMGLPGMTKPVMPAAPQMATVAAGTQDAAAHKQASPSAPLPAAAALTQLHAVPSAATMSAAAAAARILSPSKSSNQLLASVGSPAAKALAAQQAAVMAMAVQQQQLQQQQAAQVFPSALSSAAAHASRPQPVSNDPAENYELSDKGSDSEEEEEERPRKPIPDWARGAALDQALAAQYGGTVPIDPDALFDEIETCDLEAIFPNQKKKRFQKRTSSGLWVGDRLTAAEKDKYRQEMGFAAIQAAQAAASAQGQAKR